MPAEVGECVIQPLFLRMRLRVLRVLVFLTIVILDAPVFQAADTRERQVGDDEPAPVLFVSR